MLKIDYLKNHPQHLKTIVYWVYNEWWKYKSEYSFGDVVELYKELLNDNRLPIAIVALIDNVPVGSALICETDPDIKMDVTPWLEGVFVIEQFRKMGVAKTLVQRIETIAAELDFQELYLSTHLTNFYEKLGWNRVLLLDNNDTLFKKQVNNDISVEVDDNYNVMENI
jgi:GNAT superfamily N-acetyltransferase